MRGEGGGEVGYFTAQHSGASCHFWSSGGSADLQRESLIGVLEEDKTVMRGTRQPAGL